MTLLKLCEQKMNSKLVPGAGLEPAWAFKVPQDFKSCASANFATRAEKVNGAPGAAHFL